MEILKTKRYLGLVGIVLLILGTFLPYYTWNVYGIVKGSISLIGYWEGYVVIVAAIACTLFIFKDYVEKYVPNLFNSGLLGKIKDANPKMLIIPIIIAALVALYLTMSVKVDKSIIKFGLGFWSLWAGVVVLIAHTFIYKPVEPDTVVVPQQPVYQQPMQNNYVQPQVQPEPMQNNFVQQPEPVQNNFVQQPVQPEPVQNTFVQQPVQPEPVQNTFVQQPVQPEPVQNTFVQQPVYQQPVEQPQVAPAIPMPQPVVEPQQPVNNLPDKFCPNCGTKVPGNTVICPTCGRNF